MRPTVSESAAPQAVVFSERKKEKSLKMQLKGTAS
jgi:hypothetical protein